MLRLTVYMACLVLIIVSLSCSGANPGKNPDGKSAKTKSSDTSKRKVKLNLSDFPENIFDDMKADFQESGMTLSSLQRSKKGEIVKASISEDNAETYVPKAIKMLSENFQSVEQVIIQLNNQMEYSLTIAEYEEITKNNGDNTEAIYLAIWDNVSKEDSSTEDIPSGDSKPLQAGM